MGIHIRQACTQRLSTMAGLRAPNGGPPMDLVRDWNGRGPSAGCVLYSTGLDVYLELRTGRLGNT